MAHAAPRLLLVAVVVIGAACTAATSPGLRQHDEHALESTVTTEAEAPIPDDALWVPDDDSLTFVRVDEREVSLAPGQVLAGVAYRRLPMASPPGSSMRPTSSAPAVTSPAWRPGSCRPKAAPRPSSRSWAGPRRR